MNTQIILSNENAFRADARRDTTTLAPRPDDRDALSSNRGPNAGGFSQRELRDLVLHWMG